MLLATRAMAAAGGQQFFADWMRAAEDHRQHASAAPPEQDRWTRYQPQFFSPAEFAIVDAYTAILIPSDGTPGAREAHVAPYIDFVVNAAAEHSPETQREWKQALAWLTARNFGSLNAQDQLTLVKQMAAPEADKSKKHEGFPIYRLMKQMTVFAFYTSRAGLVENLEYKGLAYLTEFPACTHPEHRRV